MAVRTLVLAVITAIMLGACGCSSSAGIEDNGPDLADIARSPQSFVGAPISMRAMPVFWTAAYATADGVLSQRADPTGWLMVVVVNPRKVTQGLLVCAHSTDAVDRVQAQSAQSLHIEGQMKTFVKTDLVKQVKDKHGVDLVTTPSGQPLYVEMAAPLVGAVPSGTPAPIPPDRLRAMMSGAPSTSPAESSPVVGPARGGPSPSSGESTP